MKPSRNQHCPSLTIVLATHTPSVGLTFGALVSTLNIYQRSGGEQVTKSSSWFRCACCCSCGVCRRRCIVCGSGSDGAVSGLTALQILCLEGNQLNTTRLKKLCRGSAKSNPAAHLAFLVGVAAGHGAVLLYPRLLDDLQQGSAGSCNVLQLFTAWLGHENIWARVRDERGCGSNKSRGAVHGAIADTK